MAYLVKNRHGTFYLRIQLNRQQRDAFGRREVRKSLGTKSIREARRLVQAAYVEQMAALEGREFEIVKHGPLLSEVVNYYANHQEVLGLRVKTIEEKEFVVNLLKEVVKDKPIEQYTTEDARSFREVALKLPPRFNSLLDKGLTLEEIISNNNGSTISVTSYNNYLKAISAIFNFAVREGRIKQNPFKGFNITQKVKPSSYRDVFKSSDLNNLFTYLEQHKEKRPERYWIPLICYYTGARLNEIAQLYKDDIKQVDGVWCIHITDKQDDQRLKNPSSERMVPLHSDLISMGLLKYVSSLGTDRLFPLLKYSESHGYGAQVSIFFSTAIKKAELQDKVSLHSLRHTFVHTLKQHDVSETLVGHIVGHTSSSITYGRYGKDLKPSLLKPVIELVPPFSGL